MNTEGNQCQNQLEGNEHHLRATPERMQSSPISQESDKEPVASITDNGTPDKVSNFSTQAATQASEIETRKELSKSSSSSDDQQQNPLDIIAGSEGVGDEVDYNMPIAKTPYHTSAALSESFHDLENTSPLEPTSNTSFARDNESNTDLNEIALNSALDAYLDGTETPVKPVRVKTEFTVREHICDVGGNSTLEAIANTNSINEKSALDAYLDGIATPVAPIRVKAEFTIPKTPQRESCNASVVNKDSEAMESMDLQPPPPPSFSSNSALDFIQDGIATPRISLAAINRLRVKSEFSIPPSTLQHFNDDTEINIHNREAGEVSPSISDDSSDNEPIPKDFFDDLLHDKLKERIQEAQNNELEEKYSDRLRELEKLKRREEKLKRKKAKKLKKKSKKRSRSRSRSPRSHDLERNKRSRTSPSRADVSNYTISNTQENCFRGNPAFNIKLEFPADSQTVENVEKNDEVLNPKQKRERAVKRAIAVLEYLKKSSNDDSDVFSSFPFVSTVRKLPTSHSYVQQQVYENRSPLHTVNNVSYKFSSHTSSFNMEEWGLAALPPHAANLAKIIGCDAQYIHNKLKTIKIPAKLKKVKQELSNIADNEEEEEVLIETASALYSNAMTQTDDVSEFEMPLKTKGYEVGVQAEPAMYSIGSQTLETQSPTKDAHKNEEAPIMQIMHDLNENQLMAIHAFVELIKEPNATDNAMELYKIQRQILDIYKMSQMPSTFVTTQNPIVNNYTTTTKTRGQPAMSIKSIKGADGKQFMVNDPRAKSATYTKRIGNDDVDPASSYDSRYSTHARPPPNATYSQSSFNRSSSNVDRHYNTSNYSSASHRMQSPPTTTKHYGRGGLRR